MDTCYSMDEPWKQSSQWKKASVLYIMMPFMWNIRKDTSTETQNRSAAWKLAKKFTTNNPKETFQGDGNVLKLYCGNNGGRTL